MTIEMTIDIMQNCCSHLPQ